MALIFSPFFVLAALTVGSTTAITPKDCVEYIPGNFNMIISVPHGGYWDVPNCPKRTEGCLVNGQCFYNSSSNCLRDPSCDYSYFRDGYTQEISRMVVQNITNILQKTPHLIIMKCTRSTLDVNREKGEAAQSCPNAEIAYEIYHNKIQSLIDGFAQGKGLLFDMHGQGHDQNSTEMGYAISKRAINSAVASPTNSFPTGSLKSCSIRALLARVTSGGLATNYDVLIGQKSIGKLLELEGFAALPGPTYPTPGNTSYLYFDGGYTIRNHSSASFDAIQMESPSEVRTLGGPTMRAVYALALAKTITSFFNMYYA